MNQSNLQVVTKKYAWVFWTLAFMVVAYATYAEWVGLSHLRLLRYDYAFFDYAYTVVLHHQPAWELYNIHAQQTYMKTLHFPFYPFNQFVYPPQFAVFWSFFGMLPFNQSAILWMSMSAILFGLGIFLLGRMLWPTLHKSGALAMALVSIILTPVQIDIGVGNVNSILFASLILTYYFIYKRKQEWIAGIPLGLAIVFKVTPLAVLVYLLLRKRWRTGLSSLITVSVITGLTVIRFGMSGVMMYMHDFLTFGQTSMKNGPAPYNQSILGVMKMFVAHHWLQLTAQQQFVIFIAFAATMALLILYITRKTEPNWQLDMSLASLSLLIFSPLVEEMHLLFALPALFVLARRAQDIFASDHNKHRIRGLLLATMTLVSFVILSLPTTFALNVITNRWPQMFWLHTQMFWVLLLLCGMIVWQFLSMRRHPMMK